MGRRKLEKCYREDRGKRNSTFVKRKGGLFKKASELSLFCGCRIFIRVESEDGKLFVENFNGGARETGLDRHSPSKILSGNQGLSVQNFTIGASAADLDQHSPSEIQLENWDLFFKNFTSDVSPSYLDQHSPSQNRSENGDLFLHSSNGSASANDFSNDGSISEEMEMDQMGPSFALPADTDFSKQGSLQGPSSTPLYEMENLLDRKMDEDLFAALPQQNTIHPSIEENPFPYSFLEMEIRPRLVTGIPGAE